MRSDGFLTSRVPGISLPVSSASWMAFLSGGGVQAGAGIGLESGVRHRSARRRVIANRNVEIRTFHLLTPRMAHVVEQVLLNARHTVLDGFAAFSHVHFLSMLRKDRT